MTIFAVIIAQKPDKIICYENLYPNEYESILSKIIGKGIIS